MERRISNVVNLTILVSVLNLLGSLAEARVVRIQITPPPEVVAGGISFGESGPYEKLRGMVFFEVNPNDPHNAVVFDLDKAPRNAKGMVEFSADMFILRPMDPNKRNGRLFFEPPNRGRLNALRAINDTPPAATPNIPRTTATFANGFH